MYENVSLSGVNLLVDNISGVNLLHVVDKYYLQELKRRD